MATLVAVGDSIVNAGRSWAFLLAEAGGYELSRVSRGGATSGDVIAHQLDELDGQHFDVCALSVGTNDALVGTDPATFEANLTRILDATTAVADIVLVQTLPVAMGTVMGLPRRTRRNVAAMNEVIVRCASRGGVGQVHAKDITGKRWMGSDRVHPTAAGQHMIYLRASFRLDVPRDQRPDPGSESAATYALGTAKAGARILARSVLKR